MTLTHREITELLGRHGLSPSRALGQNFVSDPNTVRRIVRLAGIGDGDPVIEIGPGVGSLTTALCEVGAEVTAIELDRHLLPVLAEVVEPLGVRVIHGDALEVDWSTLLASHPSWTLVANLPYNVATTIVLQLLDDAPAITSMLVMVQREVGERLASAPGSGTYGIPSVKLALTSTAEVVGRVPPTVFIPQPRVESALVRITRRPEPVVSVDHDELMTLVRTAFGQRRKMLRRSLSALVTPEQFERAGVAPDDRPEQLGVMQWDALTAAVLADR